MSIRTFASLFIVTASLGIAGCATMPEDAEMAGAESQDEQLICRRDEGAMGTRLGNRVCRTAEEWAENDAS